LRRVSEAVSRAIVWIFQPRLPWCGSRLTPFYFFSFYGNSFEGLLNDLKML
jgi:hypothetical protein